MLTLKDRINIPTIQGIENINPSICEDRRFCMEIINMTIPEANKAEKMNEYPIK